MTIMQKSLKRQSKHLKNFSFLLLFVFVLFSASVFSIRINNCSLSGENYVDLTIYNDLSSINNWSQFSQFNRGVDIFNISLTNHFGVLDRKSRALNNVRFIPALAISDDFIYPIDSGGTIYQYRFNYTTGLIASSSLFTKNIPVASLSYIREGLNPNPLIVESYLYVSSSDGYLYQLDKTNITKVLNTYYTGSAIYSSPIFSDGFVYVASTSNGIYKLKYDNISILNSSYFSGGSIYSTPVIDENYVYVLSSDGYMYKLEKNNITISSAITNLLAIGSLSYYSPALYKEHIYVPVGNNIYKINKNTMVVDSNVSVGYTFNNPIVSNGFLFVSDDLTIYQYNITNGFFLQNSFFDNEFKTNNPTTIGDKIYISGIGRDEFNHFYPILKLYTLNSSNISNGVIKENIILAISTYSTNDPSRYNNLGSMSQIYFHNGVSFLSGYTQSDMSPPPYTERSGIFAKKIYDEKIYSSLYCPTISFVNITEINNSIINRTHLHINTSVINGSFVLSSFNVYIYNQTNQIENFFSSFQNLFLNYSPITNITYYFNATAIDSKGNRVWTETRKISNVFFYIIPLGGTCFDDIKNQDETDVDYNGVCGHCKNYTLYSDDTSYQVLRESGLYVYPFDTTLCDEGDAVVGGYSFVIFFIIIGIFGVFAILFLFFGVPFIIFAFGGNFALDWWKLIFKRRKNKDEEKQQENQ